MYDTSQYLTEEQLSKHNTVVKGPKGMKWLHALSPVFSTIPGDIRIINGARKHYVPKYGEVLPDTIAIQVTELLVINAFCQLPLFTKQSQEV